MSLGKLVLGYYLGKSSEDRNRKRRKRARLVGKAIWAGLMPFRLLASTVAKLARD